MKRSTPAPVAVGPSARPDSSNEVARRAASFQSDLADDPREGLEGRRIAVLAKRLEAMGARIEMLQGHTLSFDEELRRIYDAHAPAVDEATAGAALAEIARLLPGDESLHERVAAFRQRLQVPAERLRQVYERALSEYRSRTPRFIDLPPGEDRSLVFVSDRFWQAAENYLGAYESRLEVNTDLASSVTTALQLACHEAYPGHHVWGLLREQRLVEERGCDEYRFVTLYAPDTLIYEGTAQYAVELAFPGGEKLRFLRDVLFPLAGLSPDDAFTAARLASAQQALHPMIYIGIPRAYLNGEIDREGAIRLNQKYGTMPQAQAEAIQPFLDNARSFVVTYFLGHHAVKEWVEAKAHEAEARWDAYSHLLLTPLTVADLAGQSRSPANDRSQNL